MFFGKESPILLSGKDNGVGDFLFLYRRQSEKCCFEDCIDYPDMKEEIGICQCEKRRDIRKPGQTLFSRGGS